MAQSPSTENYAFIIYKHCKISKIVKENLIQGKRPLDLSVNHLYFESPNPNDKPVFNKSLYKREDGFYTTPVNYRVRVVHVGSMDSCVEVKANARLIKKPNRYLQPTTDDDYCKLMKDEKKQKLAVKKVKNALNKSAKIRNSNKIKNLIGVPNLKQKASNSTSNNNNKKDDSNEDYSSNEENSQTPPTNSISIRPQPKVAAKSDSKGTSDNDSYDNYLTDEETSQPPKTNFISQSTQQHQITSDSNEEYFSEDEESYQSPQTSSPPKKHQKSKPTSSKNTNSQQPRAEETKSKANSGESSIEEEPQPRKTGKPVKTTKKHAICDNFDCQKKYTKLMKKYKEASGKVRAFEEKFKNLTSIESSTNIVTFEDTAMGRTYSNGISLTIEQRRGIQNIKGGSNGDSLFVGRLLQAVYSTETLAISSIFGNVSNRSKKGTRSIPLDNINYEKIKDIYVSRLKSENRWEVETATHNIDKRYEHYVNNKLQNVKKKQNKLYAQQTEEPTFKKPRNTDATKTPPKTSNDNIEQTSPQTPHKSTTQ